MHIFLKCFLPLRPSCCMKYPVGKIVCMLNVIIIQKFSLNLIYLISFIIHSFISTHTSQRSCVVTKVINKLKNNTVS